MSKHTRTPEDKALAFVGLWRSNPKLGGYVCHHVNTSNGASPLDSVECRAGDGDTVADIVERFLEAATDHCDASQLSQRYCLAATGRRGRVLGQCYIRLQPNATPGQLAFIDTEEGTAKAQLKVSLAHQQAIMKLGLGSVDAHMTALMEELSRLRKRCEFLEDRHQANVEKMEAVQSRHHERLLELHASIRTQERHDRLFDRVEDGLIPHLIGHVTGASPVMELLESIDDDKRSFLFNQLDDEGRKLMSEIIDFAERARDGIKIFSGRAEGDSNNRRNGEAAAARLVAAHESSSSSSAAGAAPQLTQGGEA